MPSSFVSVTDDKDVPFPGWFPFAPHNSRTAAIGPTDPRATGVPLMPGCPRPPDPGGCGPTPDGRGPPAGVMDPRHSFARSPKRPRAPPVPHAGPQPNVFPGWFDFSLRSRSEIA